MVNVGLSWTMFSHVLCPLTLEFIRLILGSCPHDCLVRALFYFNCQLSCFCTQIVHGWSLSITILFVQFLDLLHWVISPNSRWPFLVSNLCSLLPHILLFILFVLVAFVHLPPLPVSLFRFRMAFRPFVFFMNFFFLFLSFSHETRRSQVTISRVNELHMPSYLNGELKITKRGTARNLIVFMIEAFDLKSLKSYNRNGNSYVPLIDRLARRSTIAVNLRPQPYTTTSLSAIFASQCGLPMVSGRYPIPAETVLNSSKLKCVSDFLVEAGYQVYTAYSGLDGPLAAFMIRHGHHILDGNFHFQASNRDLIHWFRRRAFRELLTHVQPFALFLLLRNRQPSRSSAPRGSLPTTAATTARSTASTPPWATSYKRCAGTM
jgi:hypothetical protein